MIVQFLSFFSFPKFLKELRVLIQWALFFLDFFVFDEFSFIKLVLILLKDILFSVSNFGDCLLLLLLLDLFFCKIL